MPKPLDELVAMAGRLEPLPHCGCDGCEFTRAARKWFLAQKGNYTETAGSPTVNQHKNYDLPCPQCGAGLDERCICGDSDA